MEKINYNRHLTLIQTLTTSSNQSPPQPHMANNAKYDTISLVNAKYDTISSVKHGAKPLVVVMSRIVRAVCRPPYFIVF